MTHAHADHAGALEALAREWRVPIYAHNLELPYLNGTAAYPPPDPGVGGGIMPALSVLFPRGPFNVASWLQSLPSDKTVPGMPGWEWVHTPGHTPGHISLWRESDRTLIVGDAFVTTRQESVYSALTQKPEMHGPPMYYTQNFEDAEMSVRRLAVLEPELVVTGHGRAARGEAMRNALHSLAAEFRNVAVPKEGQYIEHPTSAEVGSAYVERGR
jgi:glyoxylase-like metal-dependent hydrolase (beta-lactamase superfamily II)